MPHLLIAGATGSGKSVCVNTIITSLVYRHTPKTLRFLMVDPKMVELSVYNMLPHLRHKVVTDNRDAAAVLKWAVLEMQDRYELLAANGCRNIQDFNATRAGRRAAQERRSDTDVAFEDREYKGGILPYIVVDHRRDGRPDDDGAGRGRDADRDAGAEGARDRHPPHPRDAASERERHHGPDQGELPEPHRLPRRVAGRQPHDHRRHRAPKSLLGNGDMLFIPPGKSRAGAAPGRVHLERRHRAADGLVRARREQRKARVRGAGSHPRGDAERAGHPRGGAGEGSRGSARRRGRDAATTRDRDKLFREAAEVVIQHQQGSTSLLQRRLKVGYGRAARIIDQLHAAGVLGPPDGSKPRDVLVGLDDLDRIAGPRI